MPRIQNGLINRFRESKRIRFVTNFRCISFNSKALKPYLYIALCLNEKTINLYKIIIKTALSLFYDKYLIDSH